MILKKSEKVTYAPKESLDQQPWKKKGFCAASFGPDLASLGPTGPCEINMQKKLAQLHKGSQAGQKK